MSKPFGITLAELDVLMTERDENQQHQPLVDHGGVAGVVRKLEANTETGLLTSQREKYREAFGANFIPLPPQKAFWRYLVDSLKDPVLIVLILCAILLLALQDFLEGGGILVAVVICSLVTCLSDWSKDRQFRNLSAKADSDKESTVIRDGGESVIPTRDIVVGDLVVLSVGTQIPCDGLFIRGFNVSCNEASMTGEPFAIKKNADHPFFISGTEVTDGNAVMLTTNVGVHSQMGKASHDDSEEEKTPLQMKLDDLVLTIGIIGSTFALATFMASIIRWTIIFFQSEEPASDKIFTEWVSFLTVAVTIIVVAVPEGLPLAVVISLAYSMSRMLKDNNFVRHLSACETMGGATNICSDKTGTLTENRMTVVRAFFAGRLFKTMNEAEGAKEDDIERPASQRLIDLYNAGVALDSTAFIQTRYEDPAAALQAGKKGKKGKGKKGEEEESSSAITAETFAAMTPEQQKKINVIHDFMGNKTECAMLMLARKFGSDYRVFRDNATIAGIFTFNSDRKRMSTIIDCGASMANPAFAAGVKDPRSFDHAGKRIFCKGASEIVLGLCTRYVTESGEIVPLTDDVRATLNHTIEEFARAALRTLTLAYNDLPADVSLEEPADTEKDLIFIGLCGIQDPLRREVPRAIRLCRRAGILVRMVTGDNIMTASAIAQQCNILHGDGIALEGFEFRKMSDEEIIDILPRLQVLARAQPLDKQRLVELIRRTGEVVAVTGDGANDAPALRAADIGLAMGITGTDAAKNAAKMVILDDNFVSIVNAVMWGRCVFDNIRRFLQFQVTVNVGALVTAFIGAVATGGSPLTAIQLLWVNLIMDTLAALALATEGPTDALLFRPPYGRTESLISPIMWRNIIIQSIYQVAVMLAIQFAGATIYGLDPDDPDTEKVILSLIFNTFVLCQLFNEFNSRKVMNEGNMFEGLGRAPMFIIIWFFCLAIQALIVEFGGPVTSTVPHTLKEWGISIGFGVAGIPLYWITHFLPGLNLASSGAVDVAAELAKLDEEEQAGKD